jgi:hypothetical protein
MMADTEGIRRVMLHAADLLEGNEAGVDKAFRTERAHICDTAASSVRLRDIEASVHRQLAYTAAITLAAHTLRMVARYLADGAETEEEDDA